MNIHAASLIKQMSPRVRAAAEKEAAAHGQSLEKFIEEQLAVQITEANFSSGDVVVTESVRADRWNVGADHRNDARGGGGTRVNSGISGRF